MAYERWQIKDLDEALSLLGWSRSELARRVYTYPASITRWRYVPGGVKAYIEVSLLLARVFKEIRRSVDGGL